MLKHLALLVFLIASLLCHAQSDGVLLRASFNGYNTMPDYMVNKPAKLDDKAPNIGQELQLRMHGDVTGQGNSVLLHATERIAYPAENNIRADRGTISFWVQPQNWDFSEMEKVQVLLEVSRADFRIIIYKYTGEPGMFLFYMQAGKNKCSVVSRVKFWKAGQWRKIDAAWDGEGMELYLDAKLLGRKEFQDRMDFPADMSHGAIFLNNPVSWHVNPERETAYDELVIRDRKLSGSEILQEYRKVRPEAESAAVPRPFAVIPAAKTVPKLDGKVEPGEWEDATSLLTINHLASSLEHTPIDGRVCLKHDDKTMYALCRMLAKREKRELRKNRDGEIWLDDSMDLLFTGADGKLRHFIVNEIGTIYDALDGDAKWSSGVAVATSQQEDAWLAELAIPLSDLGMEPGSRGIAANFGATRRISGQINANSWAWVDGFGKGFASSEFFGTLDLGKEDEAVDVASLGEWHLGRLKVNVHAAQGCVASGKYENAVGDNGKSGKNICQTTWNAKMPVGTLDISLEVCDGKSKLLYSHTIRGNVQENIKLSYLNNPESRELEVLLDLSGADIQVEKGIRCVLSLVDEKSGECRVRKEWELKQAKCSVFLPFGDSLEERHSYSLAAEIPDFGLKTDAVFRVPDMTPYRKPVAVNHDVPKPWTAVRVEDRKAYVMEREYVFADGILPQQIIARGGSLFARPPQLLMNGRAGRWSQMAFGRNWGDYVETSAEGSFDGVKALAKGELWFDGMYKWSVDLLPENGAATISSLNLNWQMPAEQARYVLNPYYVPWKDGKITLNWTTAEKQSLLWLMGVETGLAWWCQSDANWTNSPDRKQLFLTRNGDCAEVRINVIDRPVELKSKASYTMVFQGTPPKALDCSFRKWRMHPGLKHGNWMLTGHGAGPNYATYNQYHYVSMTPAHPKDFGRTIDQWLDKGCSLIYYSMPSHFTPLDPEYDYFYYQWRVRPGTPWSFEDEFTGVKSQALPCCGNTGCADWQLANANRLLDDFPKLLGLYFDISHVVNCDNERHGCGGVDAFGKRYSTSIALHQRDYFLRVSKICQAHGKLLLLHAHNAFYPFVHGFADWWCPGEEQFYGICQKPEYYYMEEIPFEAYQSAWSGETHGCAVQMIGQTARAYGFIKDQLSEERKELYRSPEAVMRATSPCLLHDIQLWGQFPTSWRGQFPKSAVHATELAWSMTCNLGMENARFHGYWHAGAPASASPEIKISYYTWEDGKSPYKALLVIVNTCRHDAKLAFKYDRQFPDSATYINLDTDRAMLPLEMQDRIIPGNHFMMLGVKR